jgi:hypothetical protein
MALHRRSKLFFQVCYQLFKPISCQRVTRLGRQPAGLFQTPQQLISITAFTHIRSSLRYSTKELGKCSVLFWLLRKFGDLAVTLP